MERFWKWLTDLGGLALIAVGTFYTVAAYYREPAEHAVSQQPTADVAAMTPWWALVMIVFGAALLITSWTIFILNRRKPKIHPFDKPLRKVAHQNFANQVVPLDGIEYIECTFSNVIFSYQGTAGARFTLCKFPAPNQITLQSGNPVVAQIIEIMGRLGSLSDQKTAQIHYQKKTPDED